MGDSAENGSLFDREPAVILTFVAAVVNLAVGFGLGITGEQVALINAFATALIGLAIRHRVTPVE